MHTCLRECTVKLVFLHKRSIPEGAQTHTDNKDTYIYTNIFILLTRWLRNCLPPYQIPTLFSFATPIQSVGGCGDRFVVGCRHYYCCFFLPFSCWKFATSTAPCEYAVSVRVNERWAFSFICHLSHLLRFPHTHSHKYLSIGVCIHMCAYFVSKLHRRFFLSSGFWFLFFVLAFFVILFCRALRKLGSCETMLTEF